MKSLMIATSIFFSSFSLAHDETGQNDLYHKSVIKCAKQGCSVVCNDPNARWDTFLESKGDIEVTYFFATGIKQLKADMGNGEYTLLDTNPSYQTCRINGVVD